MERDTRRMRGERPYVLTEMLSGAGIEAVIAFIIREGMLRLPDQTV